AKLLKIIFFILINMGIALSFPYINQNLVDKGILANNKSIVLLFIASQLMLFFSDTIISIIRNRLLLKVNAKISLHIVSNFLKKLLSLPIRFFDSKSVGDVTQRIQDHQRIQQFLTGDLINSAFAILELIIYNILLFYYQIKIGILFIILGTAGILWIFRFQKKRARLDYMLFNQNRTYQEKLHELVIGMQEVKLYGSEDFKRWEWEFIQQKLFRLNIKSLSLEQWQHTGFVFFSYLKNILISYFTAIAVINGQLSLGIMLSVSYIIGATNGPLEQLVNFFKNAQNANLSLSRLQEVHQKQSEEVNKHNAHVFELAEIPASIEVSNVSFQYNGPRSSYVLKDIQFTIPKGKITAIVGESGSGKTTLMKLLLGFYKPVQGTIQINGINLSDINPYYWRSLCGTVMQDGYIFYDTIKRNICLDGKEVDKDKFTEACTIANVDEFVQNVPLGYKTLIGSSGLGLSGGQKQRILIARAVYKNPQFIFFDEATSSLDANNEHQIMAHLQTFFKDKTVLIIAHRLSTVKNADNIIVLEKGHLIEQGTHQQLVQKKGNYFRLVKNQLELGD
ncbi:MAG: peptidase domain-containing ABC transporter, partial [Sediminibacterium sp.]|nr:peptidase domain-containing ABC transporter [Sediminibacterium sp.]